MLRHPNAHKGLQFNLKSVRGFRPLQNAPNVPHLLASFLMGLLLFSDASHAQQTLSPIERAAKILLKEQEQAIAIKKATGRADAAAKAANDAAKKAIKAAEEARKAAGAAKNALKKFDEFQKGARLNSRPRPAPVVSTGRQSLSRSSNTSSSIRPGGSAEAQLKTIEAGRRGLDEDLILERDFSAAPPHCSQCDEGIFLSGNNPAYGPLPSIDDGRLKFTIRSQTGSGAGGLYFVKFKDKEVMPGESLYVRWQQRMDAAFQKASKAGQGFKLAIIGDGHQRSCSSNEIVFSGGNGFVQGYHACGKYQGFEVTNHPSLSYVYDYQPGGDNNCWASDPTYPDKAGGCFRFVPDEDFTFEVQVDIAARSNDKSRIRLWVTRESRARELVIDYRRVLVDAEKGYGAVWLLPYNTRKDSTVAHPEGHIWYDNLVVKKVAPAQEPAPVSTPVSSATPLPGIRSGKSLADCKAVLTDQGSGWCEIKVSDKHPGISSVWPTTYPPGIFGTGPDAILHVWTGAAFDAVDQKMYFMGGGHGAYGGNEVYEFDLTAGKWTRLTDPASLTHTMEHAGMYHPFVDARNQPPASHTYDGVLFNRDTRTIILWPSIPYGTAAITAPTLQQKTPVSDGGLLLGTQKDIFNVYEFNPSRTETRHGLAPLTWRRIKNGSESYVFSAQLPDGRILAGGYNNLRFHEFDGDRLVPKASFANWAGWGAGSASYDPVRKWVWIIVNKNIWAYDLTGKIVNIYIENAYKQMRPTPIHGNALEFGTDGRMYSWDGYQKIHSYDPDTETWWVEDWTGKGPYAGEGYSGRTFSKFRHIGDNLFVGYATHTTGVWIYKPANRWQRSDNLEPS